MPKSLIALIGATVVGLGSIAPSGHADAGCFSCAVGAGIVGGVAAGAIVGSAIANSPPPAPPGYYPPPATTAARSGLPTAPCLCSVGARLSLGTTSSLGRRLWLSVAYSAGLPIRSYSDAHQSARVAAVSPSSQGLDRTVNDPPARSARCRTRLG